MGWLHAPLPKGNDRILPFRLISGVVICMVAGSALGFQLVTPEEFQRDSVAADVHKSRPRLRTVPKGPIIQVLAPPLEQPVRSPLRIEIRFLPAEGAEIDMESLRVLYGRVRLDVTERILKYAKTSKDGLSAERAELPDGSHRFLVRIADTLRRVAEREISVTVQPSGGN